jgi:hypothetical protein
MRNTIRTVQSVRTVGVAVLALFATVFMGASFTVSTTAVQLLGNHALKGTQVPIFNETSDAEIQAVAAGFGVGTSNPGGTQVVDYPASWRPFSNGGWTGQTWDQSVRAGVASLNAQMASDPGGVIFGYSQGAIVASEYKKQFEPSNPNPPASRPSMIVLLGNGDRPNGGVLARFSPLYIPGLDMTATGATPTDTGIPTVDYAGQYDPIADAPTNPANLLAMANAGMGTIFVHLNYTNSNGAIPQDTVGDTTYYLIPTYPVPLLMPLDMIPVIGPIAADTLDPLVRMLVETGYNRNISPGTPTSADFTYFPNPVQVARNIPVAITTGLDNGLQDLGAGRPLNTDRPDIGPGSTGQGAYGIGGPPVTMNSALSEQATTFSAPQGGGNSNADELNSPPPPDPSGTSSNGSNGSNLQTNVLTLPLVATPGQTGMSGTKPSQPKLANPVKSVISGVTNSIKSVVKAVTGQKDSTSNESESSSTSAGESAAG